MPSSPTLVSRRRARNAANDILDAAQRVVARDGAARLSLDAIAREVGLTKGGVLYNFKSKAALLQGMLIRMLEAFEALAAEHEAEARARGWPCPCLRGVIEASTSLEAIDPELQQAILAAAAVDPMLLDPVRTMMERHLARTRAETRDVGLALVVFVAVDGLVFEHIMQLPPRDAAERALVRARLLRLLDGLDEGEPRR